MNPLVSVVIPTRNRLDLLAQTLHTVLLQQVALEVIVVDEGSTDGTTAWLSGLGEPRVVSIRHEVPRGLATARNVGLAASRGRWVAFVDDDDLWMPHKLTSQLELAERERASWAYGGVLDITGEPTLLRVTIPSPREVARLPWRNVVPGGGSNVLAERDLLDAVGGFDTVAPIVADWDLWIRLAAVTPPAVLTIPIVVYRIHGGNMSRGFDEMREGLEAIQTRYRLARGGEDLDWDDAYRWIGAAALRAGDVHIARRVALAAVRAGHPGAIRRLARSLVPVAPRVPVADPTVERAGLGRFRARPVVAWPAGTEAWVRDVLRVTP
jgi:glycosyltransferase involved in cell wall biosynthesis